MRTSSSMIDRSTVSGRAKLKPRCLPALRITQSRVGFSVATL